MHLGPDSFAGTKMLDPTSLNAYLTVKTFRVRVNIRLWLWFGIQLGWLRLG